MIVELRCEARHVRDAAGTRNYTALLTEHGILLIGNDGRIHKRIEIDEGRSLVATSHFLVVAAEKRVLLIDIDSGRIVAEDFSLGRVDWLSAIEHSPGIVSARVADKWLEFRVFGEPPGLQYIAELFRRPWYVGSRRAGSLLATLDDAGKMAIEMADRSVTL
ncbi:MULTISPECIES: hypothetical protein [Paraburkholderia]|nr:MULTISPECIES: hypothetical protein [Paraburkholderia]MCO4882459.1 hypothetical protein [Paraburkholderia caribensis]PTB24220.1 hypothetical protein C9I56_35005 [Paraburkholderia caribensis]